MPLLRLRRPAGLVPRASREHPRSRPLCSGHMRLTSSFKGNGRMTASPSVAGAWAESWAVSADPEFPWAEPLPSEGGESSSIARRLHSLKCKYFICKHWKKGSGLR